MRSSLDWLKIYEEINKVLNVKSTPIMITHTLTTTVICLCTLIPYIANNMDSDQAVLLIDI